MNHLLLAYLPSPSHNGFYVGPLFVHAYGIAYVFAVLAAVTITARRWQALGGERQLVYDVALWGFPAGVIGGRLYFLATSWNEVPPHWWGPFAIWKGGLGIWGGIAMGAAVGIWRLRRHRADVVRFMDAVAPALLVAQAIGRVGNYFNQELFGLPSRLPWALEISPAHRPAGYASFATFQPTFLYELIWNLLLAGGLVLLGKRRQIKPPGLFALYVAGYSLARMGEEQLRIDPSHHFLGLRLNFFVACALFVIGLVWFVAIQRGWSLRGGKPQTPVPAAPGSASAAQGPPSAAQESAHAAQGPAQLPLP
jgi:prolipoprotein diacylglyceryl transferase